MSATAHRVLKVNVICIVYILYAHLVNSRVELIGGGSGGGGGLQ